MRKAYTKEVQASISPDKALTLLKEGNQRFVENKKEDKDLLDQMKDTSRGQYPFATVLSCIDSRVSSELIFDQGIGDIFSARVAGNIVNEDMLGSMEFACKLAGTKIIVVLGHTSCGAVKGACDNAQMGNLTALLSKIKPAVVAVKEPSEASQRNSGNLKFVDEVAKKNVQLTLDNIRTRSQVLKEMEEHNEILLIGGMYDISSGKVTFFEA
ncbi:carbonic anhydrase family protein [Aquimarina sp. ERC-38]|uniref:carbonic anhydrase family protein n=1 Tax=Aquimarina sp. ERC-38 TaxID=2949996 RepID=UPI0022473CC2|nr:carbonic anhydrase family protein [Aquimarina sp. ERC-38]UZO81697.1 carbonic anhydrase family protein [Aquimarina sp. ERC-38]